MFGIDQLFKKHTNYYTKSNLMIFILFISWTDSTVIDILT